MKNKRPIFNARASTPWSKDDAKFGQRMLEKMGWKKGEGLGTHNQGITENINLNLKLDFKGLGYKVSDQDQWLKVEHSFSDVLSRLNDNKNGDVVTARSSSSSTKSLESESMKSKSRVHYRKFTRGKDVSRYNEKDLLGILGQNTKRSTDENDKLQCDSSFQSEEQDVVYDKCTEIEEPVIDEIKSSSKKSNRSNVSNVSSDAIANASDDVNTINSEVIEIRKVTKREKRNLIVEADTTESVPSKKKKSTIISESRTNSSSRGTSQDVSIAENIDNALLNPVRIGNEEKNKNEKDDPESTSTSLPMSNIDENNFEYRKRTKAERIVERNSLLKKLLHKDVDHDFTGSNLANINGYGNCGTI